jgi:hypothetical protein
MEIAFVVKLDLFSFIFCFLFIFLWDRLALNYSAPASAYCWDYWFMPSHSAGVIYSFEGMYC